MTTDSLAFSLGTSYGTGNAGKLSEMTKML